MSLEIAALFNTLQSHALETGLFERVNTHEPKNSPGNGLHCAIYFDSIEPARGNSGLNSTTARVVFNVRIYLSMLQEPQDNTDIDIILAVDALYSAYSADFDMGANAKNIDLLGASGNPMRAQAGYVDIGGKLHRVMTISIPVIVNDVWAQVA